MNIKYISLFSLLFVAGLNAGPRTEKLDRTKKEFKDCRPGLFGDCSKQEEAFKNAREEFLKPFHQLEKEGTEARRMYEKEKQSALYDLPVIGDILEQRAKIKYVHNNQDFTNKVLLAVGSEAIKHKLEKSRIFTKSTETAIEKNWFLSSNDSTIAICEDAINASLNDTIATPEQVAAAKETLAKIIRS